MTKQLFKPGDRVKIFGLGPDMLALDRVGEVVQFHEKTNWVAVREDGDPESIIWAHPRQCRRLVKKLRRRVWVIEQDGHLRYGTWHTERFNQSEVIGYGNNCREIEFIEVPRPKWRTADVEREEG